MFVDRNTIRDDTVSTTDNSENYLSPYDVKIKASTDLYELLQAACVIGPVIQEYKAVNGGTLQDISNSLRKTMIKVWKKYEDVISPDPDCSDMLGRCEFELISLCASLCGIFNFIDTLPNPDKLSGVYYEYSECKYNATRVYSRQDKLGMLLITPATSTVSTTMAAVLSMACSCADRLRSKFKTYQNRHSKSERVANRESSICEIDLLNV